MKIGYVQISGRGATDAFLARVVDLLQARGMVLAGTVQTNLERQKSHPCDMDLQVLPDGPVLRISQDLGAGSRGCRLNGGVLEQAVMQAGQRLDGAAALIVNKFGKLEAQGHGYVPLNPAFPVDRTRAMLVRSACRSLIVDESAARGLPRHQR